MSESRRSGIGASQIERNLTRAIEITMESLESRQFLSASLVSGPTGQGPGGYGGQGGPPGGGQGGPPVSTIEFAAIAADQSDILTTINSNAGVITAQAKLATDLPTISADTVKLQSDQSQLTTEIEAQLSA